MSQELRDFLQLAVVEFTKKLPCVKENASMIIHYGEKSCGSRLGREAARSVSPKSMGGQAMRSQDSWGRPTTPGCATSHSLSQEHLTMVRNNLEQLGNLSKGLRQCLDYALMKFKKEPQWVQCATQIEIHAVGKMVTFISGKERFKMKVALSEKGPQYEIKALSQEDYVESLTPQIMPLSIESLEITQSDGLGE
ncbi:hypothetical protein Y1Q_0024455 [Alligator mississippiensis]|uniref:Uncharacterized protein n=1 Tax=Alligator mississippiensis TaxID=8496 RepID=A0A151N782_ALLMI|nr:hypothetical protein Y1Q_0024455 [Alligator mississippiensis]